MTQLHALNQEREKKFKDIARMFYLLQSNTYCDVTEGGVNSV